MGTRYKQGRVWALTADAFELLYAERSGVTVEWLHRHGRYAEPCDCSEPDCVGWAMGYPQEDAIMTDASRPDGEPGAGDPGGPQGEQEGGDGEPRGQHEGNLT